ncbi:MAG: tRNA1(Val) (adenine(37)-N6)-methyltransferase [Bradymonadia bacterium]
MKITPGPDETLDRLSATLQILQRRKGHRATSDDVILAALATEAAPQARNILDLGTGKATVAMMMARRLPHSTLVGVEAEPVSAELGQRNTVLNDLGHRLSVVAGDVRDAELLQSLRPPAGFDLITGAPPFMPLGTGVLPQDRQRATGRFELRGGVEAYAHAAAPLLAESGRLVILMDGLQGERAIRAFADEGLRVSRQIDISPRPGRPPTYSVVFGERGVSKGSVITQAPITHSHWAMRNADGDGWSARYGALRAVLELDPVAR